MNATPSIGRLGIAGLGLIGGSVAAAVRARWPSVRIVGHDTDHVVAIASERRLIDERARRIEEFDVDLLVLAVPVGTIPSFIERLARADTRAVVTDVGSTKRAIVAAADEASLTTFVGGHPMAGAETTGLEQASADLFVGRPWAIVPGEASTTEAIRAVETFAGGLGARPRRIDAAAHDRVVAYVSHLPQLVAVALMRAVGERCGPDGLALAGRALAEMTRLAASPARLWAGILHANADHVTEACRELVARLPRDATALDDTAVTDAFQSAGAWRVALDEQASGSRKAGIDGPGER